MTSDEGRSFLHRWSRRKIEAREGILDEDRAQNEAATDPARVDDSGAQPPVVMSPEAAPPTDVIPEKAEAPPLTLQDVQALTRDSDFAPFVSQHVTPEVRNAALKKLFADPHYNVMDGLDTYIDDYSNMEPLPAPMLRRMVSAQALKMFESRAMQDDDGSVGEHPSDIETESERIAGTGQVEVNDGERDTVYPDEPPVPGVQVAAEQTAEHAAHSEVERPSSSDTGDATPQTKRPAPSS